jgi:hypothetical protein
MAWIALFSASLILGGVSACPAASFISLVQSLRRFSRRGVWANSRPSVVPLRIHGWSAGRDSITRGYNSVVFAVECGTDVDAPLRCPI